LGRAAEAEAFFVRHYLKGRRAMPLIVLRDATSSNDPPRLDRSLDDAVEDLAIPLVVADANGCIVAVNLAGAAALGQPSDALLGRSLTGLLNASPHLERATTERSMSEHLKRLEQALDEIHGELERVRRASEGVAETSRLIDRRLLARLSEREHVVVRRVLAGYRVSTIAAELYLSQSTVRNHLSSAFRKLGVHSQAELLERARADAAAERSARVDLESVS
jgi:DNA-binding CsgD family transcriptional regulator